MSGWSSHITAQKCTVQLRRLVRMRFLYQPIIPPRMVAMGFPSRRSESLVLCGRTEATSTRAIRTVVFGEKSGRFEAIVFRFKKSGRPWAYSSSSIVGVYLALCAFVTQTLHPEKLTFLSAYTIEVVSLAMLILSEGVGLKRLKLIQSSRLNASAIVRDVNAGALLVQRPTTRSCFAAEISADRIRNQRIAAQIGYR